MFVITKIACGFVHWESEVWSRTQTLATKMQTEKNGLGT